MSYFDPEVYNFEALKPEDQKLIKMYDFAVDDAMNREFVIDELTAGDHDTLIGKLKEEIANEAFDILEKYLECQRMEQIVSMIDNYPLEE